ncbi:transmembrane protease serine 9-like [Bacillus rossius redtenbacheri]|uniref:transmembrane protease serine 9-like n=1 Tax=Bacillus rossius redtenbacheri TaxID=93214 RepID=UPI002FDCB91A
MEQFWQWQLPWGGQACRPGAVCTTQAQCVASGGTALGYCTLAFYTGVCCIKYEDCGRIANGRVAYFRNPRYPSADQRAMNCVFSLAVANTSCGVRVDFLEAVFAPSIDDGCYQDIVTILNLDQRFTGFNTPFCGLLQGFSTVLAIQGRSTLQVVVTIQNTRGSIWNIRLTQISCQQAFLQEEDACGIPNAAGVEEVDVASDRKVLNNRFLEDMNSSLAGRPSGTTDVPGAPGKLTPTRTAKGRFRNPQLSNSLHFSEFSQDGQSPLRSARPAESEKILGGAESRPHQFPWMAVLLLDGSLHCGGSLLSRLWVLTAAHCVALTSSLVPAIARLQVALGVHNISDPTDPRQVVRFVSNIVRHPEYNGGNNDIALVRLSEAVRYNSAVRPICLPRDPVMAGWGSTATAKSSDVLLFAPIVVLNNSFCASAWKALGVEIQGSMVCAGLGSSATCLGDSGGPLMVKRGDGLYATVGITSFGAPPACGSPTYPDVWTRVSSFLAWIALALVETA